LEGDDKESGRKRRRRLKEQHTSREGDATTRNGGLGDKPRCGTGSFPVGGRKRKRKGGPTGKEGRLGRESQDGEKSHVRCGHRDQKKALGEKVASCVRTGEKRKKTTSFVSRRERPKSRFGWKTAMGGRRRCTNRKKRGKCRATYYELPRKMRAEDVAKRGPLAPKKGGPARTDQSGSEGLIGGDVLGSRKGLLGTRVKKITDSIAGDGGRDSVDSRRLLLKKGR